MLSSRQRESLQRYSVRLQWWLRHPVYPTPLNVIIGAKDTEYSDWLPTDLPLLDVGLRRSWQWLFRTDSIDRLLSEHVFEHLDEQQNRAAFQNCFTFLKPGGRLRIAVPDGNRRDASYVAEVTPPHDGHKSLFTITSLTKMLEDTGFSVQPLEYFDENEVFHAESWHPADGMVLRSKPFDRQIAFQRGDLYYTSLIVDAFKPES
jgi:predicted SAM-dependent methyltransferase